jgi:hypothetical protein
MSGADWLKCVGLVLGCLAFALIVGGAIGMFLADLADLTEEQNPKD